MPVAEAEGPIVRAQDQVAPVAVAQALHQIVMLLPGLLIPAVAVAGQEMLEM